MEILFNYGISQEDVLSEYKALDMAWHDSLLCIASAGEIPLNMAALLDLNIVAVDNSISQLMLCRIKQVSATLLDPIKAASFLGYMELTYSERQRIFNDHIRTALPEADRYYWEQHENAVLRGVINSARFEQYIRKFSGLGRYIIGRKNLFRLFECNSVEEQKDLFDNQITSPLLRGIFNLAFHPRIYRTRGIDPIGLTHSGTRNIAEFFYQRFRNFCCNTMARRNYYLQYTFFNRVLFAEALPEYLQPALHDTFVTNSRHIEFRLDNFERILQRSDTGRFNKMHLSNIGDWMSKVSMSALLGLIRDKTFPGSKVVMRYIHLNHEIPSSVPELTADYRKGDFIVLTDRYPFYSIVPITRT